MEAVFVYCTALYKKKKPYMNDICLEPMTNSLFHEYYEDFQNLYGYEPVPAL